MLEIFSGNSKLIGYKLRDILFGLEFLKSGAKGPIFPFLAISLATSFTFKPNCLIKAAVS